MAIFINSASLQKAAPLSTHADFGDTPLAFFWQIAGLLGARSEILTRGQTTGFGADLTHPQE